MTKQHEQRPTATIYAFPAKPRPASGSQRQACKPAPQQAAAACVPAEFGRGWYHAAAIEEAEEADELSHKQH